MKKGEINYFYNFKTYFSFFKNYRSYVFLLLLAVFFIEASHIVDKFIFKELIDRGTAFEGGQLLQSSFLHFILLAAALFLFALFLRSISEWIKLHFLNIIEAGIMRDMERRFFNHIIHLSHEFFTTHKTGSLISKLIRGRSAMEKMTDVFVFNFLPMIFQLILVFGSIAYFDFTSALVIILVVLAFIIYSFLLNRLQQPSHILTNDTEDLEKAMISDIYTNIDSVKYFGKEHHIKRKFGHISEKVKETLMKTWNFTRWLDSGQTLILGFGFFFLIYFPIKSFLAGTISIGALAFIYSTYGNLVSPLYSFTYGMRGFTNTMADFQSLFRYAKIENTIKDQSGATELKIKKGRIEFNNVNFHYKNRLVIKDFTLTIPQHTKVALVGPSGAGKSTLVKLLYRFYDVDEGSITIDGIDIRNVKQESLRSELSIVPQEAVLFDDTIYNNIAFSKPEATKEEIMKAIKFAQLDKIIKRFPKKEYTLVGERGIKLSGGEKQRVSIARALLANKKVLVLDEATSALDSETEHDIQQDLEKLMKGRTSIIIAHRLSTIMKANMIVVVDNGKIVQIGHHKQLIAKKGLYQRLWHLQKGGYIK
ncbi:MAG: ABC transporter ATP-binding protein [Candidatus Nanoarchaeia archaeon]